MTASRCPFLDLNGISLLGSSDAVFDLAMEVAQGRASRDVMAGALRGVTG